MTKIAFKVCKKILLLRIPYSYVAKTISRLVQEISADFNENAGCPQIFERQPSNGYIFNEIYKRGMVFAA